MPAQTQLDAGPKPTLSSLKAALIPKTRLAHAPAPSQPNPSINAAISSLQLHPTLEAALHLLNADLPSAHFLVRHMQAVPAVEGMLLHGILHRCEGDFDNARAWFGDVRDAVEGWVPKRREKERLEEDVMNTIGLKGEGLNLMDFIYGDWKAASGLVDDVGKLRGGENDQDEVQVEERIRKEMERVIEWCSRKFGEGRYVDASSAWVQHGEEVRQMAEDMVSGNKGWRKF